MDERKELVSGDKCWLFRHGLLYIVTITEKMNLGYRFTFGSGMVKGESDITIADHLYRFPDDKEKLLKRIDAEIEELRMFKSFAILERTVM